MKLTNSVLKIAAFVLGIASVACLFMANIEKISEGLACLRTGIQKKKELLHSRCPFCKSSVADDCDEFEEWAT